MTMPGLLCLVVPLHDAAAGPPLPHHFKMPLASSGMVSVSTDEDTSSLP